jgi:hypothetical protein
MSFDPLSAALELGTSVINKIWPDPAKQAEEQRKLQELYQSGDLAKLNAEVSLLVGQIEVNKIDAASSNWFQNSWRPSIGWVCSISLLLMYIPKAVVITFVWTYQAMVLIHGWNGSSDFVLPIFPDLGASDIIGLLFSLLGVAGLRTYEKAKGINTK